MASLLKNQCSALEGKCPRLYTPRECTHTGAATHAHMYTYRAYVCTHTHTRGKTTVCAQECMPQCKESEWAMPLFFFKPQGAEQIRWISQHFRAGEKQAQISGKLFLGKKDK